MILDNALNVSELVAGHIYQDSISYLFVFIVSANGTTATGRYYNTVTGLFENYTPYDKSLINLDTLT